LFAPRQVILGVIKAGLAYRQATRRSLWVLSGVYTIQQTSSKLPANVFKMHVLLLDVCWTFAGSCKHHISVKTAHTC